MKKLISMIAIMCLTAACDDGNDGTQENNGTGTLTYSRATAAFNVVRAEQQVAETSNPDAKGCYLVFYDKDGNAADLPLTLFVNKQHDRIQAGTYTGISYSAGSAKDTYFWVHQKGRLGGVGYYYNDENGGSVTVSEKAGVYTVSLDINVTADGDPTSAPGKITGTYTGPIKIVSPK